MSNFELIDDYLTNRLGEQEKVAFEQKLGSDSALQADVDLQKHILEAVKKARIADLKAMLNNVPMGGGFSSGIASGKIAAVIVTMGIIGTSLYFYFKSAGIPEASGLEIEELHIDPMTTGPKAADSTTLYGDKTVVVQPSTIETKPVVAKSPKKKKAVKSSTSKQPKIEVVDPSDELVDNSANPTSISEGKKSSVTLSHIAVETNNANKKYNFHYQFKDGKLALYGSFDKSLYEILEIHSNQHAVFLFYKENYYLLNEKQNKITALQPIKDAVLLRKLKEYSVR